MKILYLLIVLYASGHIVFYLFEEKKFWNQLSAALVLIIFLLRLFLIK
ncbi:MAG: hypothetical protein ACE5LC_00190 [Candidatus Aminicenantales bacterium]